ncbi:Phosphodiest-domain-containing protein [Fomitopsis betulina]|nr:Phosphodiest-domain-containing protein [Fomitopsis betulina]
MGKGGASDIAPRSSQEGTSLIVDPDEERRGLLSADERTFEDDTQIPPRPNRTRNCIVGISVGFIVILLGALFVRPLLHTIWPRPKQKPDFDNRLLHSNGTHYFKKSALIVSIDGLRADYLDRGLTPHLLAIAKKGLRAKSMKPVFPTLTFPNHWALMTGLYAESHGIVANNFWDPSTGDVFDYKGQSTSWPSHWWSGEPMWATAQRAGITTANLMWPGPPTTATGFSPSYFVPWKDKVPLKEKLDQIIAWIDLPIEERPQLIMAYEPSLDQAGHLAGPASELVNKVLHQVDVFARDLHDVLEARNLTDIFDVVFVSDHGMTDTSDPEWIYVDDILGDGFSMIEHEDGWPSMGLRFKPETDAEKHLRVLLNASEASGGKFDVYTHDTMPERWHFAQNERIAPMYIVPRMGYALTNHIENGSGMSKGNHGYDNDEPAMHAMFVAHGPFSAVVKAIAQDREEARGLLPRWLARPNKGWHSTADDTYVMDTFENVNIYNLMIKLIGVESFAAPTNGTKGIWDQYF